MNTPTIFRLNLKTLRALAILLPAVAKGELILLTQNNLESVNQTVAISASSSYGTSSAAQAIDGQTGTYWLANGFSPQSLTIDFKASYFLTSLSLLPNDGSIGGTMFYSIKGSNNGTTFTDIYDSNGDLVAGLLTEGQTLPSYTSLTGQLAFQYIQIDFTAGSSWPNITELEVYGATSPIPEPSSTVYLVGIATGVIMLSYKRGRGWKSPKGIRSTY